MKIYTCHDCGFQSEEESITALVAKAEEHRYFCPKKYESKAKRQSERSTFIKVFNDYAKRIYRNKHPEYYSYLDSEIWQIRKRFYRDGWCGETGGCCPECWAEGNDHWYKLNQLHLHHNTYVRLGWEELEDLDLLCETHHKKRHEELELK
jgi:hypothetical protein